MFNKVLLSSLLASLVAAQGAKGQAEEFSLTMPVSAYTQPSETARLVFRDMGVVGKVLVRDGDLIKKDQLLTKLDDDVEQKQLQQLKLEAESTSRIEAAQAELELRTSEYERMSSAEKGYSVKEREEARLRKIGAEKQLKIAQEEHQIAQIKFEAETARVEKMRILAPFDGIVQKIVLKAGEGADPRAEQGAIIVVKNDPLWVEVNGLLTRDVARMKTGDVIQVRYEDDAASATWQDGKIIYINPVADATSKTQMIRLELSNKAGRASGLHMEVKLPNAAAKTASAGN